LCREVPAIFSSLCWLRIRRVDAALRHTIPADGNQWRTVWQQVILLIFIASSSVLQRKHWYPKSPGECFTSSRNSVLICSNGQRQARPAGNDFSPSTPDCVNQLIQLPTEERAQQSVLATGA